MSDKGKELITKLAEGFTKSSDLQREFLMGYAECMAQMSEQNKAEREDEKADN